MHLASRSYPKQPEAQLTYSADVTVSLELWTDLYDTVRDPAPQPLAQKYPPWLP